MTDMLKVLGTFAAAMLLMAPAAFAQGGREGRGRGGRRRGEASGRGRERMLERFDEDGDGLVDCVDPDCEGRPCGFMQVCLLGECF